LERKYIEDETIFVISPVQFDLNDSQTALKAQGFDRVKKGITLRNTRLSTNGVTSTDDVFWGTASNALKLGGIDAANFVQTGSGNTVFTNAIELPDAGLIVGNSQDFQFKIDTNGFDGVIQNITNNGVIKFKVTSGAGTLTHVGTVTATGIVPAADNTFTLGSASLGFSNVYATAFTGEATRAATLRVGSDFRSASASASNNTVAVRDATGNIAANLFQGTATQARYADLAEKYTTDQEYPIGTVMAVGGTAETRAAKTSDLAIGVISDKPAYLMNSESEGQAIGLKGRVPVRVLGPVKKGQAVYAWEAGVASTLASNGLVGIALETNNDEGEKLVEGVLKV
jgi:hypothetical protein